MSAYTLKTIIAISALTILISCSYFKTDSLEKKEQTKALPYIAWGCDCANWATIDDIRKYSDNISDTLAERSIFIEPADPSLILPDTLCYTGDIINFTGHFYIGKGFPKGYSSEQNVDKARVFRYTKYQIIKSNYKDTKDDTLE